MIGNPELESALPAGFEFYHLGSVRKAPDAPELSLEGRQNVVISLQGEHRALVVALFDEDLDLSTYTELANIVASRLATSLSATISPPKSFKTEVLAHLIAGAGSDVSRFRYLHQHDQGPVIPIEVLIVPLSTETADA